MKGSIARLLGREGWDFIRGEDGCRVFFDHLDVPREQFMTLSVGDTVEYRLRMAPDRLRPVNVRAQRNAQRDDRDAQYLFKAGGRRLG